MGGGGEGSGNLNISIPISVEKSPVQSALSSAVMSSGHQRRTQTSYVGCGAKDAARAKTHFPPRGVPPPGKILEECGDGYAERSTTERRKLSPLALSARPGRAQVPLCTRPPFGDRYVVAFGSATSPWAIN